MILKEFKDENTKKKKSKDKKSKLISYKKECSKKSSQRSNATYPTNIFSLKESKAMSP